MPLLKNPVLEGFYPDPSILRVGKDYYIATSTFEWFPGVTLLHSKDLKHWETLKAPLTDDSVLNLTGIDSACGIWAPNLTYSQGTYYLIYTIVYTNRSRFKDTHNYLISAKNIEGPWSEPVYLNCSGFDPSLFHDDDGKKWLVNMTIDHRPYKERFSGIVLQEYDDQQKKLVGPVYPIFPGTSIGKTEGPNLCKRNGWYYLICAEGGTEGEHCCTVTRSKTITGPYAVHPQNPVLTSLAAADYPVQRAGHGTLVQLHTGQWLMAHLCSRPIEGYSILGRETALQEIEWTPDDWFHIISTKGTLPMQEISVPNLPEYPIQQEPNRQDFDEPALPRSFLTLRQSAEHCGLSLTARPGWLRIQGGNSLSSKYFQHLTARRLQHTDAVCITCVEFHPQTPHHMAGLVCYYNYDNYYYLKITADETLGTCVAVTSAINKDITEELPVPVKGTRFYLKAEIHKERLTFSWSENGELYHTIPKTFDMCTLSDEHVDGNGFTGAMVGICCQDLGGAGIFADFDWFEYQPIQ